MHYVLNAEEPGNFGDEPGLSQAPRWMGTCDEECVRVEAIARAR